MPGRLLDNGRQTNFSIQYEVGPDGDIQVVTEKPLEPIAVANAADRRFTVTNVAANLTNIPATAQRALLSIEVAAIRWLDESVASPTISHGHLLVPPTNDAIYFWILGRTRILNWKMIRATGVDATAQISYYP